MKLRTLAAFFLTALFLTAGVPGFVPGAFAQVEGGGGGSGSGVKWKGVWGAGTAYKAGDLVSYSGAAYLCHTASPAGTLPTDTTKWAKTGILVGATKLLDATLTDVTTGDPTRGDVIVAQGASPKWAKKAKGTAGDLFVMGANEPGWAGTMDTAFKVQTLAAPTGVGAVCNAGASGVTVNRYFQLVSSDAAGAESLPGSEVSVLACPDDSTITLTWTPAVGAAGVGIYWGTATGAKAREYQDASENPTLATITFTILTGQPAPNLEDDSAAGMTLPAVANARGLFYDFAAGFAYGSRGWFTDFQVANDLFIGSGTTRVKSGTGVPAVTCGSGDLFLRSDGASNTAAYACTAANTWAALLNTAPQPISYVYRKAAYCYGNGSCGQPTDWDWNGLDSGLPTYSAGAAGTSVRASADYYDAGTKHSQTDFQIPSDWNAGTVTLDVYWGANVADAGKSAVWQAATVCASAGDALNTAFGAYATVTSAAHASAWRLRVGTITLNTVGCAAGDVMTVDVKRDPNHASDNLGATAALFGVRFGYQRQ